MHGGPLGRHPSFCCGKHPKCSRAGSALRACTRARQSPGDSCSFHVRRGRVSICSSPACEGFLSFYHQHFTLLPLHFQVPRGQPVTCCVTHHQWDSQVLSQMCLLCLPHTQEAKSQSTRRDALMADNKSLFVHHCISLDLLVKPKFLVGDKLLTDIISSPRHDASSHRVTRGTAFHKT